MKKILALLMMAVMLLSVVPAVAEEVPTFVITLSNNANTTDYEDNYFTKWIEEGFGCNLEFQILPAGEDFKTKLNVMVTSGEDLGDLLFTGLSDTEIMTYADAGAILPMTEYFDGTTNLDKLSEELGMDMVAASKLADGENWFYPGYYPEENNMTKYRAWINTEWLERVGKEMPTTPEELYDVLVAFKEQDANGNGDPNDEIPMLGGVNVWSGNPLVFLINPFVYWDADMQNLIIEDGKLDFAWRQEEYRDALIFINKLVDEGLLATDTFTITDGQYQEYCSTDPTTVGIHCWTHLGKVTSDELKKQYQYLPYLIGEDGEQRVSYQPYDIASNRVCFIPSSAKDPAASFALADWMFTTDGYIRARFGVEDVHYTAVTDPETLEILKSDHEFAILETVLEDGMTGWTGANNMSWHINVGCYTGSSYMCQWNGDPDYYFYKRVVAVADMMANVPEVGEYVPVLTYSVEETETRDDLRGDINTYWKEMQTRFVLGEADINDDAQWETYLNTLNDMGVEEWLEAEQSAYDRVYGSAE